MEKVSYDEAVNAQNLGYQVYGEVRGTLYKARVIGVLRWMDMQKVEHFVNGTTWWRTMADGINSVVGG